MQVKYPCNSVKDLLRILTQAMEEKRISDDSVLVGANTIIIGNDFIDEAQVIHQLKNSWVGFFEMEKDPQS